VHSTHRDDLRVLLRRSSLQSATSLQSLIVSTFSAGLVLLAVGSPTTPCACAEVVIVRAIGAAKDTHRIAQKTLQNLLIVFSFCPTWRRLLVSALVGQFVAFESKILLTKVEGDSSCYPRYTSHRIVRCLSRPMEDEVRRKTSHPAMKRLKNHTQFE